MARLSANGKELARVRKVTQSTDDPGVEWTRVERVLMESGWILQNVTIRYAASQYRAAHNHSFGWSRFRKTKAGVTPEVFISTYAQAGWEAV